MNNEVRSTEVTLIARALARMPGSVAVNVTSKKYPRLGPTGPCMYEERTRSFPSHAMPDSLGIPPGAEEVFITVQGAVPEPTPKSELVEKLNDLFGKPEIGPHWDARARFTKAEAERKHYELTVFMNPSSRSGCYL